MNVLVIGGTQLMGVHLVNKLLADGHTVTIATRGTTPDPFGERVSRLVIERTDPASLATVFGGQHYDVIYDSLAYSSNEIKYLLDVVRCKRYIQTSTVSVYYPDMSVDQPESDFDPTIYPLVWLSRTDDHYSEIKRQAECAMFQTYAHVPGVAVRFPLVIGTDDYTKRLLFYVERIAQGKPMYVDNLDAALTFIFSDVAGDFLASLLTHDFTGPVNASNTGTVSVGEIIAYIEQKTGKQAVLSDTAEPAKYNAFSSYSLNLSQANQLGYLFGDVRQRFFELLDIYIEQLEQFPK